MKGAQHEVDFVQHIARNNLVAMIQLLAGHCASINSVKLTQFMTHTFRERNERDVIEVH